jgi:hypothetical protein
MEEKMIGYRVAYTSAPVAPQTRGIGRLGVVREVRGNEAIVEHDYNGIDIVPIDNLDVICTTRHDAFTHKGITVHPSYYSPNGSGRYCRTLQGWVFNAGGHRHRAWNRGRRDAIKEIDTLHSQLSRSLDDVRKHGVPQAAVEMWPEEASQVLAYADVVRDEQVAMALVCRAAKEDRVARWVDEFLGKTREEQLSIAREILK